MTDKRAPTPPSNGAELQYGLHDLIPHNADVSYMYNLGEGQYFPSNLESAFVSSEAVPRNNYLISQYGVSQYPEMHGNSDGLGIQYVRNTLPHILAALLIARM